MNLKDLKPGMVFTSENHNTAYRAERVHASTARTTIVYTVPGAGLTMGEYIAPSLSTVYVDTDR